MVTPGLDVYDGALPTAFSDVRPDGRADFRCAPLTLVENETKVGVIVCQNQTS